MIEHMGYKNEISKIDIVLTMGWVSISQWNKPVCQYVHLYMFTKWCVCIASVHVHP